MKIKLIILFFIAIWISLLVRIFNLAVQHNALYEKLAKQNTYRTIAIAPVRGEILDDTGKPIAINKLGFKIALAPHLSKIKLSNTITFLSKYINNINIKKILKEYTRKNSYFNHHFIDIIDFIPYQKIIPIYTRLELNKNIHVVSSSQRYYPYKTLAAHVIGYVGKATVQEVLKDPKLSVIGYTGKNGLEKYYNKFLEGKLGYKKIKVNAQNEVVQEISQTPPTEDHVLTLNLNMQLEKYITDMFTTRDDTGAFIVMKTNGAIVAAASLPEYNLNNFITGISVKQWDILIHNPDHPFTDKLINGLFPPGSVIKIALGLIFLTTTINEHWTMFSRGYVMVGHRKFRDWKRGGHGTTNIIKAITQSVDDFFYTVGLKTGIKVMSKGLKRFGLGQKTGVDLPNEFIGTVPNPMWKFKKFHQPWYLGDTANTSIGQGYVLVTPMQIARLTDLFAIGKLVTPHFAKMIGNRVVKPVYKNIFTKEEKQKLHIIQQGMYDVCNSPYGTATRFMTSPIRVAGKTGTAQVVSIPKRISSKELRYYKRPQAWLTVYGPYRHPQYIVTVLVEHGGHGKGYLPGIVVSKTFDWLLAHGYIKGHH